MDRERWNPAPSSRGERLISQTSSLTQRRATAKSDTGALIQREPLPRQTLAHSSRGSTAKSVRVLVCTSLRVCSPGTPRWDRQGNSRPGRNRQGNTDSPRKPGSKYLGGSCTSTPLSREGTKETLQATRASPPHHRGYASSRSMAQEPARGLDKLISFVSTEHRLSTSAATRECLNQAHGPCGHYGSVPQAG